VDNRPDVRLCLHIKQLKVEEATMKILSEYEQSVGRMFRKGQKPVIVHTLSTDGITKKISETVRNKKQYLEKLNESNN
jgi:intergrase/recombinase